MNDAAKNEFYQALEVLDTPSKVVFMHYMASLIGMQLTLTPVDKEGPALQGC